jgi:hypothetical protein
MARYPWSRDKAPLVFISMQMVSWSGYDGGSEERLQNAAVLFFCNLSC